MKHAPGVTVPEAALAEEIAARVVNKNRAQHGQSVQASPSSINDM